MRSLRLQDAAIHVTGFDRPNLRYQSITFRKAKDKQDELVDYLRRRKTGAVSYTHLDVYKRQVVIHATTASIEKGESLKDTGRTLQSIVDAIVMRHPSSGAPVLLSRLIEIPIINAGDGMHAHPSQGLLDAFTILNHKKSLKGLKIVTIGDIFHSRVARSDAHLFSKLGARVVFCGPDVLLPNTATELAPGVEIVRDMETALKGADVVMMLRVQQERLQGMQINVDEYIRRYQLTASRLKLAKKDAIVMHPGPMIRGMEMTDEVADCKQSVVLEQVLNGVKVRMAILQTILGGRR